MSSQQKGLKIVFAITRSVPVGGAQIHVRDLACRLTADGHRVVVLFGAEGGSENEYTQQLQQAGIEYRVLQHVVQRIAPFKDIRALLELRRWLAKLKPDIVSTHSSKMGQLGRIAGSSLGIPVIFTAHGWAFTTGVPRGRALVYRVLERLTGNLAVRVITVSEADRQLALRYRVIEPYRLVTIHNGMPSIPIELRAMPGNEPARLLMVARFQEQKDHHTLLLALARLKSIHWTLDLVGDGPLKPSIMKAASALGLSERIRFLGHSNEVAEHMREAQIYLLISNWEGFPRSILEAMRAGLPVIASDVGGCREAVMDGISGYLVPRGDVDTLTLRIRDLLIDTSLREKMGENGQITFEAQFTFEAMYRKTVGVYRDVMAQAKDQNQSQVI